ncbi:MAG: CPBP family intramembrane metalloprotease [Bacilli bacterium]|nr:CPBP family intramembrane metalloprotease [Bacilli bacterium]
MKEKLKKYSKLIKGILALTIFFSTSFIQRLIIIILDTNIDKLTPKLGVIISCISSLIVTSLLVILYRKDLIKEFKIFKDNLSENIDVGIKYWLLGLVGMMVSNLILNVVLNAGQAENEELVQKMIDTMPYLLLISAGILAPITEELVFRKAFKDNIKNKIIFPIVAGLVFGYLHVAGASSLVQFLYIIPYSSLGIAFAVTYNKTNTVFTSISMHMFHNIALTLLSILA